VRIMAERKFLKNDKWYTPFVKALNKASCSCRWRSIRPAITCDSIHGLHASVSHITFQYNARNCTYRPLAVSATPLGPQAKNAPHPGVLQNSDREPVCLASAAGCPLSGLAGKEQVPFVGAAQER
jgi:hypothetical protein